ncbi:MAG: DUF4412 domain-containing protein [Chloroherpetonaceae bacterium]|nr:DUF4412 domain-containing protein [Chloroherpetonaceae bacterium]MDW8437561.1 DUF4412 domain-containing protein [Chloroherpetonaceae bacterium]
MKKVFLIAVLCGASLSAFAQFEGEIEMRVTSATGNDGAMKMLVGKNAIRTEMTMSAGQTNVQMTSILNLNKPNVMYLINDKTQSYSEIDVSEMEKMARQMTPRKATYKVQKLGKEKILGYDCDHVLVSDENDEVEMWIAKGLMDYETFKKFNQSPQADGLQKALREANALGMPLRQVMNKGTAQETKMEVVKINKTKLPASTFEIPKGYKKTEGGLMGAGMEMMPEETKARMREEMKTMSPEQKKKMKEALKNLPPEQRKMMEQMLNEK